MNDLISRQAAIEKLRSNLAYMHAFGADRSITLIEELPSAQPKIIHCGDCRYWKNNHLCECLSKYGTFETEIYFYCGFAERRTE